MIIKHLKNTAAFASVLLLVAAGASRTYAQTLDSEELSFLTLINNYRAQNGAGPLQVSVALENSSTWMSNDMASKNYFSHTDSLGRDPFTRMNAFGYPYYPAGENIAAGYSDAQNTFNLWVNACDPDSSGACTYAHRKNMLSTSYVVIGIGRAYNAGSTYGWYWTTDFGGYLDQTINLNGGTAAPTITSFKASPNAVTAGQGTTLSWTTSGASSLTIDNGVGTVTTLTSIAVTPAQTTTYHLTASNSAGTVSAAVTVTVNAPTPGTSTYTIWPNSATPQVAAASAGGSIEIGVKFRADVSGSITGIRFYKGPYNGGIHTGSLWTRDGRLLATGTFRNETANGWQTLVFSAPVPISANTTYIASYHSGTGIFAMDSSYFWWHGADNPPLHALQSGADGPNGVYIYGNGGVFPANSAAGYNFWVDVSFVH